MRIRVLLTGLLAAAVALGPAATVPAQTPQKKTIEIVMTSYKFEPGQLRINDGDTVVIKLKNIDPIGRAHNFSTTYLMNIPLTVRGDGDEGTSEGRKWVRVQAGKQAEFEFVAKGRGSFAFLCSLLDHADKGQTGILLVQAPAP
ncbi:MAG: cupredoxin domain-containing protein [Armatimonadota bacterium]